ncbi:TIGR01457 family HAD-type hydrolase [Weissella diestrammenae]|uniref:Acid sugar phosphatase n=1 Tax=Weissella diestrammenae TaxID=1162633 RepID=A0A7G9T3Y4_9LACO|nr:TIGR01457 family HAD-type hydrolase [Weissella diestrammenae]MCM0583005.1 TIGR01457 family HAD-type hydrolase [Weissella diestrammenae]QNN74809.1 TIGR01457 family HAD-type hydrolase [Weissella diestrammenae]
MSKYAAYFIDLDGTIYKGTESFPSGQRFIASLKAKNTDYLFVTNNATKTPEMVAAFLTEQHGIETTVDQIYTSAMATADYVASLENVQKVFVLGEVGLHQALADKGFEIVTAGDADVAVIGLNRELKYEDLMQATLAIQHGAKFVATNVDTNLPNERGFIPGAGSIVAAIQTATQQEPVIIGKPYAPIMLGALERTGYKKDEVIMVGDNYQTDIRAGLEIGMDTLLVYSGVSKRNQVEALSKQPTYSVDSLDDWQL